MNPEHLRTFLAVQKHLNFTRAAEALFLSQPAVSRQIKQLERRLGVAVFEQIGKSLHLTEAGRILVPEAERLLGNIERVAEVVRRHRSAESGQLRVGASTTPGLYLLPSALGRFHRKYPKVEFHYVVEKSMSIEQRILANELDLGFVGGHITGDNLLLQKVADAQIAAVEMTPDGGRRGIGLGPAAARHQKCLDQRVALANAVAQAAVVGLGRRRRRLRGGWRRRRLRHGRGQQ